MAVQSSQVDYCNEKVVGRNKLPARSYWIPKDNLLLNGKWSFNYAQSPIEGPNPASYSRNLGSGQITPIDDDIEHDWSPIVVPGHWQLQGWGNPHYTNVPFPFPVIPPLVPSQNPTGTYTRSFRVPNNFPKDSQLRLRFDGVDSAFHLWVNGQEVGYSQ